MTQEIQEAIVVREVDDGLALSPVMNIQVAKERLAQFQEFVKGYLVENEDYGTIPGTAKPTLLKPGADKLCELYGLADTYEILDKVEDWKMLPPLFDYTIRCTLYSKRNMGLVSTGLGSCNSYESKYRWREAKRTCPTCHKATIIKGKEQYGGGWICWKKEGKSDGCGAKFPDGDPIELQIVGKVDNDDIATIKNTILKIAKKRAKVDATLAATRSSGIFTQDMEDIADQEAQKIAQAHGVTAQVGTKEAAKQVADKKLEELREAQEKKLAETRAKFAPPGKSAEDFAKEHPPADFLKPDTIEMTGVVGPLSSVKPTKSGKGQFQTVLIGDQLAYVFDSKIADKLKNMHTYECALRCQKKILPNGKISYTVVGFLGDAAPTEPAANDSDLPF
jgi:hypothetical protein